MATRPMGAAEQGLNFAVKVGGLVQAARTAYKIAGIAAPYVARLALL